MQGNAGGRSQSPSANQAAERKGRGREHLTALAQNKFASEADPTWAKLVPLNLEGDPNRVCREAQAPMHPVRVTPTDSSGFDNPWVVYERHKRLIASTSRSPSEYETRIRALAARLGL